MRHDWSDAWLQQAAGWKAVKEGLSLHARGLVQNAYWENDECRGVIQGSKPRRVRVKRLNASTAETFCSCPENQRSGAMCEHAVAIIAAAREIKEPKPTPKAATSDPAETPTPALSVRFFPYWKQEWQKGRISCKIEAASRPAEESDRVLHEWLKSRGLTTKPLPWMLSLGPADAESWFESLIGHDDIRAENQTLVFSSELPQIPVKSQRVGENWQFELQCNAGISFGGDGNTSWWLIGEQLFQSNDLNERDIIRKLFAEKLVHVTDSQLFELNSLRRLLQPTDTSDPLHLWQAKEVSPEWEGELEGSLRQLRMRVNKYYQVESETWRVPLFTPGGFLCQRGNVCFCARPKDETSIAHLLQHHGWKQTEGDQWVLDQEELILQFLSEGKAELQARFRTLTESPQWQEIQKRLTIIHPSIRVTDVNSREMAVDWEFRSDTGLALDGEKIRKLLTLGKRLIQTSDGKSLLLPKESWEAFQRTATDLHWQQQKGAFLAQKSQALLIDYLRKYVDKSLIVNEHKVTTKITYPLLQAHLREYQLHGARWLTERLESHGFALLADDMGLGKTLQTIAVLTLLATPENPALVVVPTSLLYNWESEIRRFAPTLQTLVLHGSDREVLHEARSAHVIITSYGVLMRDRALFMKRGYSLMVLDEASAIRNPDTDVARCCYRIQAGCKLALTGTPLENSMEDLWSIFQFLQPGYLGDRQQFRDTYERSGGADSVSLQSLRLRVMPFLLRRTKSEVVKDLPDKVESDEWCEMSPEQRKLYQSTWEQGVAKVEKLARANDSAAHMTLLTLLLRLRQICCDAGLFAPELLKEWTLEQRSGKMVRLFQWMDEARRSGRKMLVFSQFATQLRTIEEECVQRGISTLRLDGSTRNRQELVERFQNDPNVTVFLISLKAGGYGLNLTAATTVVHFDPWWNPAAEQQASDRAHRIGQSQAVNVYKLLTRGTVEERVKRLQADKSQMVTQLLGGASTGTGFAAVPSMKEMAELLSSDGISQEL